MFSLSLFAQEAAVECLAVEYDDGAVDYFALDANPIITYGDGTTLNVTQDGDGAYSIRDISLDEIARYYFDDATPTTSGNHDGIEGIQSGEALMTGLTEGAQVNVYTADGRVVSSMTVGKDGRVSLDLGSLPSGQVYVVRTPKTSYKIVK